jgi:thiol-disulfide isomerase/thioredoxin
MRLADLQGNVVILDFWATYCPPCVKEIPHLNAIQAKFGKDGVKVVGLNSGGPDDRPKIPQFLRNTPIDYQMAFPDDDLEGYIFADDDRIPQTLVFDRGGRLTKRIVGFDDQIRQDLDDAVQTAMSAQ